MTLLCLFTCLKPAFFPLCAPARPAHLVLPSLACCLVRNPALDVPLWIFWGLLPHFALKSCLKCLHCGSSFDYY